MVVERPWLVTFLSTPPPASWLSTVVVLFDALSIASRDPAAEGAGTPAVVADKSGWSEGGKHFWRGGASQVRVGLASVFGSKHPVTARQKQGLCDTRVYCLSGS